MNEAGTPIFKEFVLNESCLSDGILKPEISRKKSMNRLALSLMLEWMLRCTLKHRLVDI